MAYKVWITARGKKYWVTKFVNIAGVLEIHFTQDITDNVAIYPSKDIARRALIATLNHIPEAIEGGMLEIPAKIIEKKVDKNPKVCYNRHINKE